MIDARALECIGTHYTRFRYTLRLSLNCSRCLRQSLCLALVRLFSYKKRSCKNNRKHNYNKNKIRLKKATNFNVFTHFLTLHLKMILINKIIDIIVNKVV